MKATKAKLLDFLRKSSQFIIPIYQRTYSWTEPECQQLWNDIIRTGKNDGIPAHFIGSIVYIEKGLYHVTSQTPLLVIDGQQRLTTTFLILEALVRCLGDAELLEGFSAKKIRNYYLLNPLEDDERRYKLLLTQTDKQSLLALLDQKPWPAEYSIRLKENFEFFEHKVKKLGSDLATLCKGLSKLIIVDISLNRDQDNPQLIFESMNSTGRELSQADLIRNFILMGLERKHQDQLYKDHWRPMEVAFGQKAYSKEFDAFMRHYLTLKTGTIPNVRQVYEAFKAYSRDKEIDAIVEDIHSFAGYYCAMALGQESDSRLDAAFGDLRELTVDVAYPFLLKLYHDYSKELLSVEEFERIVRLVESYVFRRVVCNIPTNSLNKTFATFNQEIKESSYIESVLAHFIHLPSYRKFPKDEEFRRELKIRDLYKFRSRSYWLRKIENHDRKERVSVSEYTIEHILPQNENLSQEWQDTLGSDWKQVQEKWLHTLGNLTLTGYNAELSNHSFIKKRDMKGGYKDSPIQINKGLGSLEIWDERAIMKRAENLAQKATKVWVAPSLTKEKLDKYRSKVEGAYSIDNHRHLAGNSAIRSLFEAFRKAVLALDPCVTEEFLKRYIAYKAETNFVDVEPQQKQLRLSLNLQFHELHDPRKLAKDITNLGRWGNGDVEVRFESPDELRYIMGLVRQAFEKQMGNEGSGA